MFRRPAFRPSRIVMTAMLVMIPLSGLYAQNKPVVGSSNVALANPPMPVPETKPCTVQLFPSQRFGANGADNRMGALPHRFQYKPPAECKGPWSKVVLVANFSVDPGHQYDRTASIWLDNVNLYYGTTQEPSPKFGPSWKIERDLTAYSSMLRKPGKGEALINNWVDARRGSYIHASARLLFYPADARFPAHRTPNKVYPLNSTRDLPANLQTGNSTLTRKIQFPRNTTRVYMDVFAQSQFHDEFWYTCLPKKYLQEAARPAKKHPRKSKSQQAIACSGGSYREVEVSIDGHPAGLAPVYPWIYSGGIDPYLWRPTPGVQTLNFVPYRLDLTPFAGLLSNGKMHSVSVRVLGSHNYFSVAAALLVYQSPKAKQTGGAVTRDTLESISLQPSVTGKLYRSKKGVHGEVRTHSRQSYIIEGYVNTPAGRVRHRVAASLSFSNTQKFTAIRPHVSRDVVDQVTRTSGSSSSTGGSSKNTKFHRSLNYSLAANMLTHFTSGHNQVDTNHLQQIYEKHITQQQAGLPTYRADIRNTRTAADQVTFHFHKGQFTLSDSRNQASQSTFAFNNSLGACYHAELNTAGGKVSAFTTAKGCSKGAKSLQWFVHPTGSPDSFAWRANAAH